MENEYTENNPKECLPITLKFSINKSDYFDIYKNNLLVIFFLYFGLIGSLVFSYWVMLPEFAVEEGNTPLIYPKALFLGCIITTVVITFVFHSRYSFVYRWNFSRLWQKSKFKEWSQCLIVTESGITYFLDDQEWQRDWQKYSEFIEKDSVFILFYISEYDENYNAIPKHAFQSDEEIALFRNFLRRKAKEKHIWVDLKRVTA